MPVGEFLDRWLDGRRQVKATTVQGARGCVQTYLLPHLGDVPLDELTADHVDAMLNWIERRNALVAQARETGGRVPPDPLDVRKRPQVIQAASQRQVLAVLHAALNHAFRRRLITFNPVDQVGLPRVPESERQVWTTAQAVRFLEFAGDDRYAAAYRVVIVGGLRRGEVCALRWSDVDWHNRRLRVERQCVYLDRRWQVTDTKTSRRRYVALDAETMAALKTHRVNQHEEKLKLAALGAYRDDGLVFAHEDGTHLNPKMLTWRFQELSREAGLPVIHLPDLRHLSATLDLLAGTDIKVVSKRMGHSRTSITQDLYQHVLDAMQDQGRRRSRRAAGTPVRVAPVQVIVRT